MVQTTQSSLDGHALIVIVAECHVSQHYQDHSCYFVYNRQCNEKVDSFSQTP